MISPNNWGNSSPMVLATVEVVYHTGTERAKHIQIIITFTQKVDNVIPDQL